MFGRFVSKFRRKEKERKVSKFEIKNPAFQSETSEPINIRSIFDDDAEGSTDGTPSSGQRSLHRTYSGRLLEQTSDGIVVPSNSKIKYRRASKAAGSSISFGRNRMSFLSEELRMESLSLHREPSSFKMRSLSQYDEEMILDFEQYRPDTRRQSVFGMAFSAEDIDPISSPVHVLRRRANSTGSIYLQSTLRTPNVDVLMHCISAVVHRNMIEMDGRYRSKSRTPSPTFDVFNEDYPNDSTLPDNDPLPRLRQIRQFLNLVFTKAKMEAECVIVTYVYVERLLKKTKGKLWLRERNWRSVLLICLILASKVWDDLSMWNVDFSMICSAYTLQRINKLEISLLNALDYEVRVPSSTYAKYYFKLREIQDHLGLSEEGDALDLVGAGQLEALSKNYSDKLKRWNDVMLDSRHRSATMANVNDIDGLEPKAPVATLEMLIDYGSDSTAKK
eukprot:TRINITY_DN774231_c0_g1_i1.p1 TRINITY_DN774231_c0_g1~~TRINITY_DN774231_c0_g1_i1.p1  ORF type:complete len:447 (+),score=101.27 TRINITY_DN774231_c0_g1_i1:74-1414(+)